MLQRVFCVALGKQDSTSYPVWTGVSCLVSDPSDVSAPAPAYCVLNFWSSDAYNEENIKASTNDFLFKKITNTNCCVWPHNVRLIWKPWIQFFIWDMIALSAVGNDYGAAQNVSSFHKPGSAKEFKIRAICYIFNFFQANRCYFKMFWVGPRSAT